MDFDIYPSLVVNKFKEIVALDNFVGDQVEMEPHVFVFFHRSHEVEVGEVHAVEFCIGG